MRNRSYKQTRQITKKTNTISLLIVLQKHRYDNDSSQPPERPTRGVAKTTATTAATISSAITARAPSGLQ